MATHDIIVIGGSAGGVEALRELVRGLPGDLPAAAFVTIHFPASEVSHLPEILARTTPLAVSHARPGERIEPGHIYIAPPNHHLVLQPGRVDLTHGPHENGVRPAIDPMFRTAAAVYGDRVVGVLLSGCLDDGTQGMLRVRERGGVTVVQDPEETLFDEMPRSAMEVMPIDHVFPIAGVIWLLENLSREEIPGGGTVAEKRILDISEMGEHDLRERAIAGHLTALSCPHCSGSLWESGEGAFKRYQCRVGHAYSPKSLNEQQRRTLESQAWTLLRAVEERRDLCERLTRLSQARGLWRAAAHYRRQAAANRERARMLGELVSEGSPELGGIGDYEKEVLQEELRELEPGPEDRPAR